MPINTYGPGSDSGTYDFFAEATLCKDCFAGTLGLPSKSCKQTDSNPFNAFQATDLSAVSRFS